MLKNNLTALVTTVAFVCLLSLFCVFSEGFSAIMPFVLIIVFSICSAVAEKEYVVLSGAVCTFLSYLICRDEVIVYTAIISALAGLVVGIMMKRESSLMTLTVASATGFAVLYAVYILILARMTGYSSLNEIFDALTKAMVTTMSAVDKKMAETVPSLMKNFRDLFPSVVMISSVTMGYITVFVTGKILSLVNRRVAVDVGFSKFKADTLTIVIFVISMAVTIFAGYGKTGIIAENIYLVLSFILQMCGLSLLDWFLKNRKKMNVFLRILIIFALNAIPLVSVMFVMAAILDARRDFRRLNPIE